MPPDIRGFFGPKGQQTNTNNQSAKIPVRTPVKTPVKESRKRKSVELDDDDEEDVIASKGKRASSRKSRKVIEEDEEDEEDTFVPTPKKSSAKKSRKISYVIILPTSEDTIADSMPRKETTTMK